MKQVARILQANAFALVSQKSFFVFILATVASLSASLNANAVSTSVQLSMGNGNTTGNITCNTWECGTGSVANPFLSTTLNETVPFGAFNAQTATVTTNGIARVDLTGDTANTRSPTIILQAQTNLQATDLFTVATAARGQWSDGVTIGQGFTQATAPGPGNNINGTDKVFVPGVQATNQTAGPYTMLWQIPFNATFSANSNVVDVLNIRAAFNTSLTSPTLRCCRAGRAQLRA